MNVGYVVRELYNQKRRTLTAILGLSIGIALLIILNALSIAYRQAAHAPLKEIGADITVQRPGDVPKDLTGAVFPCSAVTIRKEEIEKIRSLPGIKGMGKAVLLWVFDSKQAWIVLGIEQNNTIGPAILRSAVAEGRFLEEGKSEALVEAAYARQFGIRVGDTVSVNGSKFPVVGLMDASRSAKIAVANLYLPLADAEGLAASSKNLQTVSPFAPGDVNLLFLKADQERTAELSASLKGILGKKATVGTQESFLKLLGSLFALSDKFTLAASLIAILVAVLIAFKTMAGNVAERAREIGVLKAVGWTNRNVVTQLLSESVIQCFLAGILGLLIAFVVSFGLSFMKINIPIPWDMAPNPHFLPGGGDQIYKTLRLPVHIPWTLASFAVLLSIIIGGLTGALLGRHVAKMKPSEVLRHE
ncbi:MAG: ABC transporter permease, partial [Deltaproteobacteria bacterium]|nr:ABC transporter permease [Deltaproteobacteria bacterium]